MTTQETSFFTIDQEAVAEFKDKGSKFLAYAFPVNSPEDFKERQVALKKEHGKANHFCFAYKIGPDNLIFRSGDDGEPAGSAGKPILGQITSKGLTNTGVIVVRYFGGTLLGIPGLINAYKTSTALALQMVPILRKQIMVDCQLDFDYTRLGEVMRRIKTFNATIKQQQSQLFCKMIIAVPKASLQDAATVFSSLQAVDFKILGK